MAARNEPKPSSATFRTLKVLAAAGPANSSTTKAASARLAAELWRFMASLLLLVTALLLSEPLSATNCVTVVCPGSGFRGTNNATQVRANSDRYGLQTSDRPSWNLLVVDLAAPGFHMRVNGRAREISFTRLEIARYFLPLQ